MAFGLRRFLTGIILRGETSDVPTTVEGSIFHNSTSIDIKAYIGSAVRVFVFGDKVQTLTNKTIDAGSNTLSNLSHGTEVDDNASNVHGVGSGNNVVGTGTTQTLSNKSLIDTSTEFLKSGDSGKKAKIQVNNSVDSTTTFQTNGSASQTIVFQDGTHTVVGTDTTDILTNKSMDADLNTIIDLTVTNLKAGVLDTSLSDGTSALHDTLVSAKAAKDYVDAQISANDDASEITYTPAVLADWDGSSDPGNVDGGLDQVAARTTDIETKTDFITVTQAVDLDTMETATTDNATNLTNHLSDTVDAHDATAISFATGASGLSATEVNAAIVENAADLVTHTNDTSTHGVTTVAGLAETQTFSNKTFSDLTTFQANVDMQGKIILDSATDSTAGSNVTLAAISKGFVRLTSGSLVSVDTIPAGTDAQVLVLSNVAGVDVTINTSGNIVTGTGSPVDLVDTASFLFIYDSTSVKWRLVGGTGGGGAAGGLSEISTNVTSATTGTFTTNITGVPIIVARFWDDSVGQWEDVSPASLTLDITTTGTAIDYDTTGLTFDTNDYIKLTAFYNQGVSPTTNDSGWILVSAINDTLKGVSGIGYHEIDLPSGFTDDPETFSCMLDDGSNRFPADYASRLVFSNSGAQYRVAIDTTSLVGTDKFRIRTRA